RRRRRAARSGSGAVSRRSRLPPGRALGGAGREYRRVHESVLRPLAGGTQSGDGLEGRHPGGPRAVPSSPPLGPVRAFRQDLNQLITSGLRLSARFLYFSSLARTLIT